MLKLKADKDIKKAIREEFKTKTIRKKVAVFLRKTAKALKEENWAKGYYAFDKDNKRTNDLGEKAVKWCAVGMMRKLGYKEDKNIYDKQCMDLVENALVASSFILHKSSDGEFGLAEFNDDEDTKLEDVKELLNFTAKTLDDLNK